MSIGYIDLDDIPVLDNGNRTAHVGFGGDVPDARARRESRKPPVGEHGHFRKIFAYNEVKGEGKQFRHARATLGALVSDDDHVPVSDFITLERLDGFLFGIEADGFALEGQHISVLDARLLDNRALWRKITFQNDRAALRIHGVVEWTDDFLVDYFNPLEEAFPGFARDRHAVKVEVVLDPCHNRGHAPGAIEV